MNIEFDIWLDALQPDGSDIRSKLEEGVIDLVQKTQSGEGRLSEYESVIWKLMRKAFEGGLERGKELAKNGEA